MLSIPAFAQVEGITIFRDDADLTHFYYLPRTPRIARSGDGKPMFTFLRYQFPIDRPANSEPGGGYLVFTAVMTEDPALLETKVKPILRQRLQSENPTGNMPAITLSSVDFTDGEVRLIMKNVKSVMLGRPSLFADNTASIAVELSANDATLFFEALKRGGSIAAIEYDLTFPVRLPAIEIVGHVDSKEVKSAVMTYTESQVVDGSVWGDDSHTERHRTSISETMDSQGLIHLEIRKGSVELSQEDMESLRAFAFRSMDAFIKDNFLKGGSIETADDRKSQWMEFLHQDISKKFDLDVTYRDVINREYNPSAQINPSFLGVPITDVIMEIDLQNAPWYYNNLEVTIDTNLDFNKYAEYVHSVVGHLTYDQKRADGTRLAVRESVIFTASDRTSKSFKTRIADVGKDTYHVDVEVNYKAGPVLQAKLASFDTTTRNLTLQVQNPGIVEVKFATAPKAFESQLTAVELDIEYGDPRRNVPLATETEILNADKLETLYRRVIYAPWDKAFRYRYTYVLKDQDDNSIQRSTTEWFEASSATRYVNVPTPFDQQFNLTVIPAVDWKDVREVLVDLEYDDRASDYRMQKSLSFSNDANNMRSKSWKFPLRNPSFRGYRYAQKLLLQNGGIVESEWKTKDSDTQGLKVGNAIGGVVSIEVDPSDVDLGGKVKRIVVQLRYTDLTNDVLDTETLMFKTASPTQIWTIARADSKQNQYTYDVTYFMSDGTQRKLKDQPGVISGTKDFLFVPTAPVN